MRRVTVNLVNLSEAAAVHGYDEVDLNKIKTMQSFEFYMGESPKRETKVWW
ncbi:MAG: hypothetical protein Q4B82_09220 [Alysiella sp.]|uniref:hypothetical protein n=1 Tax=Alysiella sp. TaxID=1872483 RepID=UPI0026DB028B|nr:hypothetical protein [Alysiella sp.]MDO4434740.1 hypothetical protein [Alysiella sp.]